MGTVQPQKSTSREEFKREERAGDVVPEGRRSNKSWHWREPGRGGWDLGEGEGELRGHGRGEKEVRASSKSGTGVDKTTGRRTESYLQSDSLVITRQVGEPRSREVGSLESA